MDKKVCLMFSGQGSQKIGMGKSLASCSKSAEQVFDCASEFLQYDLLDLCTNEAHSQKLLQTQFAQPAIVAVSIAAFKALTEQQPFNFDAVVGHSLGSISALVAAGVVSVADCFKIVKARAEAMQQCENNQSGSMCAIIGASFDAIKTACDNAKGYVTCANFNGANQIVISGETAAVEEAAAALKEKAKRCIGLKVKAAFHSKLMEKAIDPFKKVVESIEFHAPEKIIFSNVTGKKLDSNANIKKLLVDQIISPVLFTQNLIELKQNGFETFVELGPSKPLCSMVKTTLENVNIFSVHDEKSLNETLKNLQTY